MCTPEKNLNTPLINCPQPRVAREELLSSRDTNPVYDEMPILQKTRVYVSSYYWEAWHQEILARRSVPLSLCWLEAEVHHWCTAIKWAILHDHMWRVKLWLIQPEAPLEWWYRTELALCSSSASRAGENLHYITTSFGTVTFKSQSYSWSFQHF